MTEHIHNTYDVDIAHVESTGGDLACKSEEGRGLVYKKRPTHRGTIGIGPTNTEKTQLGSLRFLVYRPKAVISLLALYVVCGHE